MGTHPIFESDFDCLTEKMGKFKDWADALESERPIRRPAGASISSSQAHDPDNTKLNIDDIIEATANESAKLTMQNNDIRFDLHAAINSCATGEYHEVEIGDVIKEVDSKLIAEFADDVEETKDEARLEKRRKLEQELAACYTKIISQKCGIILGLATTFSAMAIEFGIRGKFKKTIIDWWKTDPSANSPLYKKYDTQV